MFTLSANWAQCCPSWCPILVSGRLIPHSTTQESQILVGIPCLFEMSGLGEFCLASSFPEAPCWIFQVFCVGWLEVKACCCIPPHFQILKMPDRVLLNPMGVVSLTWENRDWAQCHFYAVERSFQGLVFSVYAFHCLLEDSIFSFVFLCYFNGLIAGTSWTFHWKYR